MSKNLFVSYSHKDVTAVEQIVASIEQSNIDCCVWFDHKLKGGEEYFSVIAEQILECDYFLFVVSPHSVVSNFCIRELEFAMSENRKIIAVWLEEFTPPPRVRLVISNTHYIRNQGMSDSDLSRAIADALDAEHLMLGEADYVLSEQKTNSEKYFVSPDEKVRIRQLLEKEQKEDFLSCFEPQAAVLLGLAYEMGVGVDTDETRADFYYHIAAYKGNPDGEYLMLALRLTQGKADKAATVRRMNKLAEEGCLKALVYWGDEVYLGNYGMTADKPTAYRWFRRAADMGDPVAKYFLAFGYRVGEVGETDYALAWMYFLEAAQQHFPRAYRQMAVMYRKGQLVEASDEKARAFYQKAIDNGDGLAVNYLGNMDYDAGDYEKAFERYSQAVEYAREKKLPNGFPYYNLGWSYEYGKGVEKDIEKAVDLYLTAASYRHKSSANRVSYMIYNELSATMERRRELLEQAASLNCTNAEYWLGRSYEADGKGQCKEALDWYEKGADKGDLYAIEKALDYYSWVQGGKDYADRDTALEHFRLYFSVFDLPDNEAFRKRRNGTMLLQSMYYAYAVELGIDKDHLKPDKQHALFYYQKCLQCPAGEEHWKKIVGIAYRYACGDGGKYEDRFYKDVPFAEEILAVCEPYLDRVIDKNDDRDECVRLLTMTYSHMMNHYKGEGGVVERTKRVAELIQKKTEADEKLKAYKLRTE